MWLCSFVHVYVAGIYIVCIPTNYVYNVKHLYSARYTYTWKAWHEFRVWHGTQNVQKCLSYEDHTKYY